MTSLSQLHVEDVSVGSVMPSLTIAPTSIALFRFSAVTWNSHRIHFDESYANLEGYPGVLVQSHLFGSWLVRLINNWGGPRAEIQEFSWQNRHYASPGDILACTGIVVSTKEDLVECQLQIVNQDGQECSPGRALVKLPRRKLQLL